MIPNVSKKSMKIIDQQRKIADLNEQCVRECVFSARNYMFSLPGAVFGIYHIVYICYGFIYSHFFIL